MREGGVKANTVVVVAAAAIGVAPFLVMLHALVMLPVVVAAAAIGGGPVLAPVLPGSLVVAANLVQVSAALPVVAAVAAGIPVLQ